MKKGSYTRCNGHETDQMYYCYVMLCYVMLCYVTELPKLHSNRK